MTTDQTSPLMEPARRPRRGRTAMGLAMATASLALLAACSSGSDTTTTSAANPTASADTAQAGTTSTAYDQCMQQNGVTKPAGGPQGGAGGGTPPAGGTPPSAGSTPPSGAPSAGQQGAPPGVDAATWQKAQTACQSVAGAPTGQTG